MTVFFPDISSYEAGMTIAPGTVAVIAKATEGTYYRDAQYENFKAQAAHVGAVFSAYHFLKAGGGAAQADYCHAMVGATPVMLDVETEGGSKPTVADCAQFIVRMRQLGGRVWGAYFPRWYWQQVGGDLGSLGVAIVASGYPGGYSDTDPNWQPYGNAIPAIWQYTDNQPYAGQKVDFNAYRGTTAQLAALITGGQAPPPTESGGSHVGTISPAIGQFWPEIADQFPANATFDDSNAIIWADGGARAAALYSRQGRDAANTAVNNAAAARDAAAQAHDDLAAKLDALAAQITGLATPAVPDIDVDALAAAVADHLTAGGAATPDAIAAAVTKHFAADLAAG